MMEMLLSSEPGVLELLPALPAGLERGAISGIRGRNRVTVRRLSWDLSAHTVRCVLRSDVDQDITLIQRRGIVSIRTQAKTGVSPLGGVARMVRLRAGVDVDVEMRIGA